MHSSQAKKLADKFDVSEELERIYSQIKKEAEQGEYKIICKYHHTKVIRDLEFNGYKVEVISIMHCTEIKISWEHGK